MNKLSFGGEFTTDSYFMSIKKKLKNNLADWLKDLSDKLRS